MRSTRRSERGQLEIGAGIVILVGILAIPLVIAGVKDVTDWAAGRWEKREPRAPAEQVVIPFVGPALPEDAAVRECYLRVAAQNSLQWGGDAKGWRSPEYPEPVLTGDPAVDRVHVNTFVGGVTGLLNGVKAKFGDCVLPRSNPRPAPLPPATLNVAGTYDVTVSGAGGDGGEGVSMTVTGSTTIGIAMTLRVRLNLGSPSFFNLSFTGMSATLDSDSAFDASGTCTVTGPEGAVPKAYRFRGRFTESAGRIVLRGAVLTIDGNDIGIDATRR